MEVAHPSLRRTDQLVRGMVSVVVPCYNYGPYLKGCVASALERQGGTAVEVIVVDDCSEDSTNVVGRELAANDDRITYVRHEVNRGHIATYNHGLSLASGEYVALLSADDLLTPGSLSRAASVLGGDQSLAFVYGPVAHTSDASASLDPADWAAEHALPRVRTMTGRQWTARVCRSARNPVASPEVVARTSAQRAVGGYRRDLPHSGDLEMWLRLATAGGVARIEGPTQAVRRMHASNMSSAYSTLADLIEVERAFEVFQEHAGKAWSDVPDRMPHIRRVLARRAVRSGLDSLAAAGDEDSHAAELLEHAARTDPVVALGPGARLLKGLLDGRPWASTMFPVRNLALRGGRAARQGAREAVAKAGTARRGSRRPESDGGEPSTRSMR